MGGEAATQEGHQDFGLPGGRVGLEGHTIKRQHPAVLVLGQPVRGDSLG
jgi:hypothetical protein